MPHKTKIHLAIPGDGYLFAAKDGLRSACGTTTFPDTTPTHTTDVTRITCPPCFTEVVQGRVPGLRAVILLVLGCNRLFLPGQLHDPHTYNVSGETVYCPGAVNA